MKTSLILLTSIFLAACSSSENTVRVPNYATMINSSGYRVMCPNLGVREIYVRYNALDSFYREDGTEKTREEFCNESTYGARSR